jgi:hypothetical protein
MTDRLKFEQMLEALINEDQKTAKELFHDIVVAKSREIYESLLAEDFEEEDVEEGTEEEEESVEEAMEEEDVEEGFGFEASDDDEMGGDPADDLMGDVGMGDEGDEEGSDEFGGEEGEEGLEDRVVDLEDALDELKAEFEALMGGEEGEEHMGGDEFGGDMGADMGGEEEGEEESYNFEDMEEEEYEESLMREYVEKVGGGQTYDKFGKMGENGVNTKSIVAKKNDMGGTTANIAKGGTSETGGTKGGLLNPSTKEENFGNINVPGGNAGKTSFKKKEPGHGAEKKGTGDNGDKSANSPINGVKSRAK